MLGGIGVLVLTSILAFVIVDSLKRKYRYVDSALLKQLYLYHVALAFAYYLYALFNPSDSIQYYAQIEANFRGETWFDHYGTSTIFIQFIGYPFIKFFGFSYEAMMALFAFFGYLGFCYFHIFFKEQIRFRHNFFGYDLVTLIFFLPNLHFWSSSFGKGSVIFLGIGLFFFGIGNVRRRWITLLIASILIYHIRPHIMLVLLASAAIGFTFSSKGISTSLRIVLLLGAVVALTFIYRDVFKMVGVNEDNFVSEGLDLSHRASELSKATSGVNISNYSLPMQVFTFLYRPLFIDAPGALGLFVSFENVFYVLITLKLFNLRAIRFLISSSFLVKTAFVSFLTVAIALAQVSGNLGLAMRQKSQVMILLMFVIIAFMDFEKTKIYQRAMKDKQRKASREKLNAQIRVADNPIK
ncbi:hypothetical protein WBG78_07260 [Chryseolinea sp. T2]|uniref:hypothetical protein n=1 Tax=Chryseolinea sp. T2 TaxID=3129255 RepID=UPI0030787A21